MSKPTDPKDKAQSPDAEMPARQERPTGETTSAVSDTSELQERDLEQIAGGSLDFGSLNPAKPKP